MTAHDDKSHVDDGHGNALGTVYVLRCDGSTKYSDYVSAESYEAMKHRAEHAYPYPEAEDWTVEELAEAYTARLKDIDEYRQWVGRLQTTPSHVATHRHGDNGMPVDVLRSARSTTRQSVPADWQTGTFKAWKEQPGHEHAPWFLVTPNGCALRMGYHNDDAEDQRQAEWLAAACNAALGSTPDLIAYPNLQAILSGTVSGHHTEWPAVRAELQRLLAAFTPSATACSERDKILCDAVADAARWHALKELAGYYQDGSQTTVKLYQDDALRSCFIEASNKTYGTDGSTFDSAIDSVINSSDGGAKS